MTDLKEAITVLRGFYDSECARCSIAYNCEVVGKRCKLLESISLAITCIDIQLKEPKHGEWIEVDIKPLPYGAYTCNYKCNKCNYFTKEYHLNFCPNCGARMKEGDEK